MRIPTHQRAVIFITASAIAVGCRDVNRPQADLAGVAGAYVLESQTGRYAPVSGTIVLTSDARAERRVRYSTAVADSTREYVVTGTFELHSDDTIHLLLNESCGTSVCVWDVRGTRTADHFTLQYPDPADGPPITETYRRQ
jgi:hypothetical protein